MKFRNHKLSIKLSYLTTIFTLFLVLPMRTFALVDEFVKLVGNAIWFLFAKPLFFLLQMELEILKWVSTYNNFVNEAGVTTGWIALRDLSNMFFILILLVIAFATILRISNYGYQQLLKKTLIIAILINFSKTIVGFLIDLVQVIMLTFISAIDEVITGGLVVAIGLQKFTTITNDASSFEGADAYANYLISIILGIGFITILVVVIGVMVMMLMMRIVALWVAIIMAPLAFLASIFPATSSFYNTWTKQLGTNLVTGPMLAFFLWLTFTIVAGGDANSTFTGGESGSTGPTEFLSAANIMNYVIAITLLLMGIKMAASSGAAGANMASKGMKGIQGATGWAGRKATVGVATRIGKIIKGGVVKSFVNKDGEARAGFKNISRVVPGAGAAYRAMSRSRIKTKRNKEAKILQEGKYVSDANREEYYRSKKIGGIMGEGSRREKFSNFISGGRNRRAEDEIVKHRLKEGKIDSNEEALKVVKTAKRTGNKAMLNQVYEQFPGTIGSFSKNKDKEKAKEEAKEEAKDLVSRRGVRGSMRDLTAEGAEGPGAIEFLDAITKHKDYKEGDIGDGISALNPKAKAVWGKRLLDLDKKRRDEREANPNKPTGTRIATDENGNAKLNEHGAFVMNQEEAHSTLSADISKTHPNDSVDSIYHDAAIVNEELISGKVTLPDNAIDKLNLNPNNKRDKAKLEEWKIGKKEFKKIDEDDTKSEDEKKNAKEEWNTSKRQLFGIYSTKELSEQAAKVHDEEAKGETNGGISPKEATDRYREIYSNPNADQSRMSPDILSRISDKAPTEPTRNKVAILTDKQIEDRASELKKAEPYKEGSGESKRSYDRAMKKKAEKQLVKENKDKQAKFDTQYVKAKGDYGAELKEFSNTMKDALSDIKINTDSVELADIDVKIEAAEKKNDNDALIMLGIKRNKLMRAQNIRRREVTGVKVSQKNNHAMKAVLRNANDGSNYKRMSELDVSDPIEAGLFKDFARVASQSQQKQILDTGSAQHLKLLAEAVIDGGGRPNKSIMETFTQDVKRLLTRKMEINVLVKEGKTHREAKAIVTKKENSEENSNK